MSVRTECSQNRHAVRHGRTGVHGGVARPGPARPQETCFATIRSPPARQDNSLCAPSPSNLCPFPIRFGRTKLNRASEERPLYMTVRTYGTPIAVNHVWSELSAGNSLQGTFLPEQRGVPYCNQGFQTHPPRSCTLRYSTTRFRHPP